MIKYEELNDEIMGLNSQISTLNVEIDMLNSTLKANNKSIEDTKAKISFNETLIEQIKNEIKESQEKFDLRVRSIYKSDINSKLLIYILESKSFSDFFNRIDSFKRILLLDKKIINEIQEKKITLDATIKELNDSAKNLEDLNRATETSLNSLELKKKEQKIYLDKLDSEKNTVFATIEENEKKLISHQLSVVNSDTSTITELEDAISTLNALIPQLNSSYVIGLAEDGISAGNQAIEDKKVIVSRGTISENNSEGQNTNTTEDTTDTNQDTTEDTNQDTTDTTQTTFNMSSTAYTGGGTTATGLKPVRDPNGISTIAVDSSVIPLGSKVFVSGYGVAIASDTGAAINGNIIDVYFDSLEECTAWGRRSVTVEILAYPGEW